MEDNYLELNRREWNKRTHLHFKSEFYGLNDFLEGKSSLNDIELELLGDVSGKSVLHLQCHFGMDSLSLARLGADVTGLDLSDVAIDKARELNDKLGLKASFVSGDVYATPQLINKKFDVVFSSYGTIGWLPDIHKWAEVVAKMLKPGGRFIFAEFHPFIWMYDNEQRSLIYNYFNSEAIHETEEGSYAAKTEDQMESISWNHGLSEVIQALIDQGLELKVFREFNYSPYPIFKESIERNPGQFQCKSWGDKVPLVYALEMRSENN